MSPEGGRAPEKEFLPVHWKPDGKKEASGLLCFSAVTVNSTTTDLFGDVVGMTGCAGEEEGGWMRSEVGTCGARVCLKLPDDEEGTS